MRSLIILEVEHGEDTDSLQTFITNLVEPVTWPWGDLPVVSNYTVRVDLPACFVLDSGSTDNEEK